MKNLKTFILYPLCFLSHALLLSVLKLNTWGRDSERPVQRDEERPLHRDEEWPPLAATRESPHMKMKRPNTAINK